MADKEIGSRPKTAQSLSEVERARARDVVLDERSQDVILSPEELAIVAAISLYSKAFLETLGKHGADALAEMVRTRIRRRKDKTTEVQIGLEGARTATLVITDDLPDEARLALLDLDVTAEEVRGKTLRWDGDAMAWRAYNAED